MSSPRKQLQGILTSVDMNIPSTNIDNTICDNLDKTNILDESNTKTCANCGKEGNDITNTCSKCKSVKYCNAACKKKHRHKHKKDCDRRVAELHDEKLFKVPPPREDCPICFLQMPCRISAWMYMSCCGKDICCGCIHASKARDKKRASLCPFCRAPMHTTDEEMLKRFEKRMELNDAAAINQVGCFYHAGMYDGLQQNRAKAFELWHRAEELGYSVAYFNIGINYENGRGVEVDVKKAIYYYELAAIRGDIYARYNLGQVEWSADNMDRALKHYMIAVRGGHAKSLNRIQLFYTKGYATKDDYTKALRLYQTCVDEVKSAQRDEAAAFNVDWTYY